MDSAKRVIFRIREADVDWKDQCKPVRLYLEQMGYASAETRQDCMDPWERQFIHIQPPCEIEQGDPKIHVVADLNKDQYSQPFAGKDLPHEFYRVRYVNGKM